MRFLVVVSVAACATGGAADKPDAPSHHADAPVTADAPTGQLDAPSGTVDAPVTMATGHLLLSEVTLAPTGAEFIEIVNPTTQAVDLTHYFVSNHGSYFKLPVGLPALPTAHFIVQFTAGASIAAGAVITVATGSAAAFTTAYGAAPTYSITDATVKRTDVSGTPSLTDTGAIIVVFEWDGTSPLVKDVDLMLVGVPTLTNALMTKSGYPQLGGTYATDANTIAAQPSAPASGTSTKRLARETGHETQAGGSNGITGDDETSEDTSTTWDTTFTAPTPGQVPATI